MAILRVAIPGALCSSCYFDGVVFLQPVEININIALGVSETRNFEANKIPNQFNSKQI
jgi:hypothetical protein